jgi:hypothetical protein
MIMGESRTRHTKMPLKSPHNPPMPTPRIRGQGSASDSDRSALAVAIIPVIDPTERSMFPPMIRSVAPTATMPTSVICNPRTRKLSSVVYGGTLIARIINMTPVTNRSPTARISRRIRGSAASLLHNVVRLPMRFGTTGGTHDVRDDLFFGSVCPPRVERDLAEA